MATTRVADLVTIASRMTRLSPAQITGPQRHRPIVRVRQAVAYVAAEQGRHSYTQIGKRLGDRDHTTIIHAHKMVPVFMRTDADLRLLVERLLIEAERHDAYALPVNVHYHTVLTMAPAKPVKPPVFPRNDEYQGLMFARDMRQGSNRLLRALLLAA